MCKGKEEQRSVRKKEKGEEENSHLEGRREEGREGRWEERKEM